MAVLRTSSCALLLAVFLAAAAPAQVASEYDVKAAFLLNFTRFVEWPPAAFPAGSSQLQICILGDDPFGKSLKSVIAGEEVQGRRLSLLGVNRLYDPGVCHVLFISSSEKSRLPEILAAVEGSPVLTVSETDGFVDKGGAINFKIEQKKVRFEINRTAVERAGLKMSSKLLRLAARLIPATGEGGTG